MSNRTNDYVLQVYRNKSYRRVYAGKLSQCITRLPSMFSRCRIQVNGKTVESFPARDERFPNNAARR